MKRSMMQAYVKESQNAVDTYLKAFDAQLGFYVVSDNGGYYHAEINIDGTVLAISDVSYSEDKTESGNVMQFCLQYEPSEVEKVKRAYDVLKIEAMIYNELGPCDYSALMADFIDRFGVRWCLFI